MEKTTVPAASSKLTKTGKFRAAYTLKCEFKNGGNFTYRSDVTLLKYQKEGFQEITELDAMVMLYLERRGLILKATLFNNAAPAPDDWYIKNVGGVEVNRLPLKLNGKPYQL